jgi:hypothetical protein
LLILISLGAAPEVKSDQQGDLALLGLLGALLMTRAIQYLPTLHTTMALQKSIADKTDRRWLYGILDRSVARGVFRKVPITYSVANILFLALALPLYFLRIESIPSELWFLLSILFVLWMFPAKLVIGWMIRRSRNKTKDAWWPLRWIAWISHLAAIGIYVGFLYLGKFALWEGGASLFFQHAFLSFSRKLFPFLLGVLISILLWIGLQDGPLSIWMDTEALLLPSTKDGRILWPTKQMLCYSCLGICGWLSQAMQQVRPTGRRCEFL